MRLAGQLRNVCLLFRITRAMDPRIPASTSKCGAGRYRTSGSDPHNWKPSYVQGNQVNRCQSFGPQEHGRGMDTQAWGAQDFRILPPRI